MSFLPVPCMGFAGCAAKGKAALPYRKDCFCVILFLVSEAENRSIPAIVRFMTDFLRLLSEQPFFVQRFLLAVNATYAIGQ